jgi:hypothetical protein
MSARRVAAPRRFGGCCGDAADADGGAWISPSVPWWKLGGRGPGRTGAWTGTAVFSRFRAVPPALSGLLSYALEAHLLTDRRRGGRELEYDEVTRQHMLAPSPDRPGLAELFHPAPLLCGLEPLARRRRDLSSAREAVAGQLRGELRRLGVQVVNPLPRARMRPWQLMLALEGMNGTWRASADAWRSILAGPDASGRGGDRTAGVARTVERGGQCGDRHRGTNTNSARSCRSR